MHFLLDIDHTLLNTTRFKKALAHCCRDCGISAPIFWSAYRRLRLSNAFSVEKFVQYLPHGAKRNRRAIKERYWRVVRDVEKYIYADAIFFLRWANDNGHKVFLYTYGEKYVQQEKIDAFQRRYAIDGWIVTSDRTKRKDFSRFMTRRKPWIWIDDFDSVPTHDKVFRGGMLLQLRRRRTQHAVRGVSTVKNLYQAVSFIKKYATDR